ncbi:mitochondrial carrier [Ceraceosorus guamensis]|uniref:Mitochondrial carrier n=1 Tax=Ceraceosorus guamensis TaxID=1522189 RepID=A0A316VZZ4_9BASI|nr:mitochondrial carrier [Ceraceosorus guamensis]PWN42023.1 mitochondrial carrier [Ceraceosorus guamensis]
MSASSASSTSAFGSTSGSSASESIRPSSSSEGRKRSSSKSYSQEASSAAANPFATSSISLGGPVADVTESDSSSASSSSGRRAQAATRRWRDRWMGVHEKDAQSPSEQCGALGGSFSHSPTTQIESRAQAFVLQRTSAVPLTAHSDESGPTFAPALESAGSSSRARSGLTPLTPAEAAELERLHLPNSYSSHLLSTSNSRGLQPSSDLSLRRPEHSSLRSWFGRRSDRQGSIIDAAKSNAALQEAKVVNGTQEQEEESAVSSAFLISYFLAGGAAGATSRTVVSPLERLKIIMQVQPHQAGGSAKGAGKGAYSGVWVGLKKMWVEEGFKGFMRGNGINCLRIAPYSAVQFSTYEVLKNAMRDAEGELDVPKRLTAGALAGIASVVSTYPLDLVRSRISIASASLYSEAKQDAAASKAAGGAQSVASTAAGGVAKQEKPSKPLSRAELRKLIEARQKRVPGIWGMTRKVYAEEGGIRALYRGCVPTSVGVAPYVAINFFAFESLKAWNFGRPSGPSDEVSTLSNLICGALAGTISQTLTYPLDVLRRRMQVAGMKDSKLGYSDKNSWAAIRTILVNDGFFGLYRGIIPNLLKVAPSIATSFATYQWVKELVHHQLHPDSHPHHH